MEMLGGKMEGILLAVSNQLKLNTYNQTITLAVANLAHSAFHKQQKINSTSSCCSDFEQRSLHVF